MEVRVYCRRHGWRCAPHKSGSFYRNLAVLREADLHPCPARGGQTSIRARPAGGQPPSVPGPRAGNLHPCHYRPARKRHPPRGRNISCDAGVFGHRL